jgi:DNA-binding transcriptional ArsR family regulator
MIADAARATSTARTASTARVFADATVTAATSTAPVFAALGDVNRQRLLMMLVRDGRASASSLAPSLDVSRQAVDKHLRVLARAGLIESARAGREVLYSVRSGELDRSAAWLRELAAGWDARLASIKDAAEGVRPVQEGHD